MKPYQKRLLAVAVVLALLFAGYRWYSRPRTFSQLLPFSPEEVTGCSVQLADEEPGVSVDILASGSLSREQTGLLLDLLSTQRYQRRHSDSNAMPALTIAHYGVIELRAGDDGIQLVLCGDVLVVNDLDPQSTAPHYVTDGGSAFQQEVIGLLAHWLGWTEANTK